MANHYIPQRLGQEVQISGVTGPKDRNRVIRPPHTTKNT